VISRTRANGQTVRQMQKRRFTFASAFSAQRHDEFVK